MVGAIFGASLGTWVSDTYGRRSSLRCSSILYLLGVLFIVGADIVQDIVLGRVLVGLALGAASITSPMYIGEVSPLNRRGNSIGLFGMLISVGQLLFKMANSTLSQIFTKLSFNVSQCLLEYADTWSINLYIYKYRYVYACFI